MPLHALFAHNLRRYREQLELSQEELGNRVGSDRTVISRYERTPPKLTLERAYALACALDIDLKVLLDTPVDKALVARPPSAPVTSAQVGANARALRDTQDLSQKDIGDRMGVDRNTISRIERTDQDSPELQLTTLEKLAAALGVKPTDMF
jgi:transcriptional regulator with XRE-family HTH domain